MVYRLLTGKGTARDWWWCIILASWGPRSFFHRLTFHNYDRVVRRGSIRYFFQLPVSLVHLYCSCWWGFSFSFARHIFFLSASYLFFLSELFFAGQSSHFSTFVCPLYSTFFGWPNEKYKKVADTSLLPYIQSNWHYLLI